MLIRTVFIFQFGSSYHIEQADGLIQLLKLENRFQICFQI